MARRGGAGRGVRRDGASARVATRWRPQKRVDGDKLDRAVPLSLAFAAVVVWVLWGFRIGSPDRIAAGAIFAAFSSVLQVISLVAAAFVTAALTAGGFGDLRRALVKFSGIVLASMAAGAVFGDFAGLVANILTFVALVVYLFDVDAFDAALLAFCHVVINVLLWLAAAAVFLR